MLPLSEEHGFHRLLKTYQEQARYVIRILNVLALKHFNFELKMLALDFLTPIIYNAETLPEYVLRPKFSYSANKKSAHDIRSATQALQGFFKKCNEREEP